MAKYIIDIPDGKGVLTDKDFDKKIVDILYNRGADPKFCRCEITPYEEPLEEESRRWRTNYGCQYYFLGLKGDTLITTETNTSYDDWLYNLGNYFRTKKEVEEYRESLLVYNELKTYAEPDDVVWDVEKFHIYMYYDYEKSSIEYGTNQFMRANRLYFPSKEIAEEAVKAVGEERVKRYYLGIKEDEYNG